MQAIRIFYLKWADRFVVFNISSQITKIGP